MFAPRVVIVGSGFAALEVAFRLRGELGDGVRLELVSDSTEFRFQANTVRLPFGEADVIEPRGLLPDALREHAVEHRIAQVLGVDPAAGTLYTDRFYPIGYDHLVIATGAGVRPDEIPGLAEYGRQVSSPEQMRLFGEDLHGLAERCGRGGGGRVLFAVPPGCLCPGPVYELAFMVETWLRRREVRGAVDLRLITDEPAYLLAVSPAANELTGHQLAARGIAGTTGAELIKVNEREAVYADGAIVPFDLLVTFPPQAAAVEYDGLPTDPRGFLRCQPGTRAVLGHPEIHAPGDAGDHPVKLAHLATLQGTAAATDIAAQVRLGALRRQRWLADECLW